MNVERLVLERSGVIIQVREDGLSCVARAEDLPGLESRPAEVGSMWRPPLPPETTSGIEEHTPGDVPGPSWWVIYGNADPEVTVEVTLEDGTLPGVHRIGNVWACEWVSRPQKAFVYRSDRPRNHQPDKIEFIRPRFHPPAPHPENER